MGATHSTMANIEVESPNISYGDRYIEADYDYCTTHVEPVNGKLKVSPFFLFFFFLLLPLPISILKRAKYSKMPGGLPNSPLAQLIAVPLGSATWYKVTNDFFFKSRLNFPSFFLSRNKKKRKKIVKVQPI